VDPFRLVEMEAADVFEYTVSSFADTKTVFKQTRLDSVFLFGEVARGILKQKNQTEFSTVKFKRNHGVWRVDFADMIQWIDRSLKELKVKSKLGESEFITHVLVHFSNKKPDYTIWKPVLEQ